MKTDKVYDKSFKTAFTIIELVFVIVILGILASVAIPKLVATKEDAQIAKAASEYNTIITELAAHYAAYGKFFDPGDIDKIESHRHGVYTMITQLTPEVRRLSPTLYDIIQRNGGYSGKDILNKPLRNDLLPCYSFVVDGNVTTIPTKIKVVDNYNYLTMNPFLTTPKFCRDLNKALGLNSSVDPVNNVPMIVYSVGGNIFKK